MAKRMTFVQAMKDYFGLRAGTTNVDFMKEFQALTAEDKEWFKVQLGSVGYEIVVV